MLDEQKPKVSGADEAESDQVIRPPIELCSWRARADGLQSLVSKLRARSTMFLALMFLSSFMIVYATVLFALLHEADPNSLKWPNGPGFGWMEFGAIGLGGIFIGFFLWLANWSARQADSLRQELIELQAKIRGAEAKLRPKYFDRLVDINIEHLDRYYALVKSQTDNSFWTSVAAASIGFMMVLAGIGVTYFGKGGSDHPARQWVGVVATGSGIITQFLGAVFFYLYSRTVRQLKDYHESLLSFQNVLLSFKIIDDVHNDGMRPQLVSEMLRFLLRRSRIGEGTGVPSKSKISRNGDRLQDSKLVEIPIQEEVPQTERNTEERVKTPLAVVERKRGRKRSVSVS